MEYSTGVIPNHEPICKPIELPSGRYLKVEGTIFGKWPRSKNLKMVSVVSGIHGDEINGLYICHLLIKILRLFKEDNFSGTVLLVPAANPLGLNTVRRFWPLASVHVDLNRIFPGNERGDAVERIAFEIFSKVELSDLVIDIHSSNAVLLEKPHVRVYVSDYDDNHITPKISSSRIAPLIKSAELLNLSAVIIYDDKNNRRPKGTLAISIIEKGGKALVIEGGTTQFIDIKFCLNLAVGICNLLNSYGIVPSLYTIKDELPEQVRDIVNEGLLFKPKIFLDSKRKWVIAEEPGLFIPNSGILVGNYIGKGTRIGEIIDPFTGDCEQRFDAEYSGYLLTLRNQLIVSAQGATIAKYCECEAE